MLGIVGLILSAVTTIYFLFVLIDELKPMSAVEKMWIRKEKGYVCDWTKLYLSFLSALGSIIFCVYNI